MRERLASRRWKVGVPLGLVLIALAILLLRPGPTDQEQIFALLQKGQHGIETKNVSEIADCISPAYHDSQNMTRTELVRLAMQWPRVEQKAKLTLDNYEVTIDGDRAKASFDLRFELEGAGAYGPAPMRLTMTFEKRRQGWHRVWLVKAAEGYTMDRLLEGMG